MIEMADESSLAEVVNQESKDSRFKRLINRPGIKPFLEDIKSIFNQAKLLPYQIPTALLGFTGGAELGEQISRMFPVPPNRLVYDLGQKLQDEKLSYIGAFVLATLASAIAKRYGPRIGDYIRGHYNNRNA